MKIAKNKTILDFLSCLVFTNKTARVVAITVIAFILSGCSLRSREGAQREGGTFGPSPRNHTLLSPRARKILLPNVPLVEYPEVTKEKDYFLRDKITMRAALANRRRYDRMLREVFKDEGAPEILLSIAFIESKFDPTKVSPAAAVGMWQFMRQTGLIYGLEMNAQEDQRRDPILSTIAAARHLSDLYERFQDWYLAIAAYNAGVNGIDLALKQSGSKTFIELARQGAIPYQSAQFVFRFIAISIIFEHPEDYGFRVTGRREHGKGI